MKFMNILNVIKKSKCAERLYVYKRNKLINDKMNCTSGVCENNTRNIERKSEKLLTYKLQSSRKVFPEAF